MTDFLTLLGYNATYLTFVLVFWAFGAWHRVHGRICIGVLCYVIIALSVVLLVFQPLPVATATVAIATAVVVGAIFIQVPRRRAARPGSRT